MSTRRVIIIGAGAAAVAGCQVYGGEQTAPPPAPPAGSATLAKLADIPVGGGKVFPDQRVVLTQPTAGVVKAFSAVCTHQGCTVAEVANGTINCPCHGSSFRIADGSVATGPATKALPAAAITVTDGAIKLGAA